MNLKMEQLTGESDFPFDYVFSAVLFQEAVYL